VDTTFGAGVHRRTRIFDGTGLQPTKEKA